MLEATRKPNRVFPTPPTPTSVKRRARTNIALASATSRRLPTKLVASAGRLPRDRRKLLATTYAAPLKAIDGGYSPVTQRTLSDTLISTSRRWGGHRGLPTEATLSTLA